MPHPPLPTGWRESFAHSVVCTFLISIQTHPERIASSHEVYITYVIGDMRTFIDSTIFVEGIRGVDLFEG